MTVASIEDALAGLGVTRDTLHSTQRAALDTDGYIVLRHVFDAGLCANLIETFERNYVPSHLSRPPRAADSRHALLNAEPAVVRACLAPAILAAAHHGLGRRFVLDDVQGRDPLPGGGYQRLHRDWVAPQGPAPMVIVLAFLDPFGPANGATRVVPGSHLLAGGPDIYKNIVTHPDELVIEGGAGDVLVMAGYLAHSAQRNTSRGTRRNLQIKFCGHEVPREPARNRPRCDAGAPDEVLYLLGEDP